MTQVSDAVAPLTGAPEPGRAADYLDTYQSVWGRPCGDNGIGRLREVALSRVGPAEFAVYDPKFPFHEDVGWLESHGLQRADVGKLQEEQEVYAQLLEENQVRVHWIDWGEAPMTAFGPMQAMWAASDLWVLRGGSVIQKSGWHSFSFGRSEYLARWAQRHLGIPVLCTVVGKGVIEPSATVWLAEDVWVTGRSCAYNELGLEQLAPIVRASARNEDLEIHVAHLATDRMLDRSSGASGHVTNLISPLDVDLVLAYPGGLDWGTLQWLEDRRYRVIEVDREEQILFTPTNTIQFAPGAVFMVKEARRTIAAVRKAGVEVVEVPNQEFSRIGGALHCRTLRVFREPGPYRN
jgi:N-dimethylarginine dimethylaminohydrolase